MTCHVAADVYLPLRRPADYADLAAGVPGGGLIAGGKVGIIRCL